MNKQQFNQVCIQWILRTINENRFNARQQNLFFKVLNKHNMRLV